MTRAFASRAAEQANGWTAGLPPRIRAALAQNGVTSLEQLLDAIDAWQTGTVIGLGADTLNESRAWVGKPTLPVPPRAATSMTPSACCDDAASP